MDESGTGSTNFVAARTSVSGNTLTCVIELPDVCRRAPPYPHGMDCFLSADTECTKLSCPFWRVDDCVFATVDIAGHDEAVAWFDTLRLKFSEPLSTRPNADAPTRRTFHTVLASGKE